MSTPYTLLDAHQAEKYVSKRYGHLPHTALHIYTGLRFLEEDQKGFFRPVIATYRDIAKVSHVSRNAVGTGLRRLIEESLVEGEIGSPVKDDKRATILTRVIIDDVKSKSPDKDGKAQKLADALNKRPFIFDGGMMQPMWTVGITGRVCASKPAFQNLPPDKRINGLRLGMPSDCTLVHSDIKSADPTIIKHVLGIEQDSDFYACYRRAAACDKPTAKEKVNLLAYCKNSQAVFNHWLEAARNDPVLFDYVQKLHDYKTSLFGESQKTRCVTTLAGRRITAEEGMRLHAGKVFCWKIQGTVADIVNAAALELIDMPEVKTLVPLHDALYVVCTDGVKETIAATLRAHAQKIGVQIQIKSECKRPPESCAASAKS